MRARFCVHSLFSCLSYVNLSNISSSFFFITVKKVFVNVTDCPLDLRLAYLGSSLNNLLCPQSHFYLAEDNSVTEVSQLRTIRSVSRLSVITRFSRDALQHEKQKKESDCEKTKKGLICRKNNFMDFMHYFFTFISLPEFPCATSLYDVKCTEREIALLAQAHKTVFGLKNHSSDTFIWYTRNCACRNRLFMGSRIQMATRN